MSWPIRLCFKMNLILGGSAHLQERGDNHMGCTRGDKNMYMLVFQRTFNTVMIGKERAPGHWEFHWEGSRVRLFQFEGGGVPVWSPDGPSSPGNSVFS